MRHLEILQSHVFLVNSRLDHFSAPCIAARVPLFRSYGVNLPNSLAMIHSSTSGFSPFPPVSVYGTGSDRHTAEDFLGSMVTATIKSPEGSLYCQLSAGSVS